MKPLVICLLMLLSQVGYSQMDIKVDMGINYSAIPSLRDYLNTNYASGQQIASFNSSAIFSAEGSFELKNYQVGLDLGLETSSFNFDNGYQLSYSVIQPTVMVYKFAKGTGYKFKYGIGVGPRLISVNEKPAGFVVENKYSGTGVGFLFRADGATAVAESAYAYIGGDIGFNLLGAPTGSSGQLRDGQAQGIKFSNFYVGLRIGFVYSIII